MGDIESAAKLFKTSHSTSPALWTQTKSESAVGKPRSILKTSDVKVVKCFNNWSMTVGGWGTMGKGLHLVQHTPRRMGFCRPGAGVVQEGHDDPARA